jgi:uncharacterized protein
MSENGRHQRSDVPGFHIMAKPIGPVCNLHCAYCFYLEKEALYPHDEEYRMSDKVLEAYVRKTIEASRDLPEVIFAWQGGEPLLMGLDFYRKATELQRSYAKGKRVSNTLQTNGTLLDDEWCRFLKEQGFLIGLSLDGPEHIHDRFRVDRKGGPTFSRVMHGLELLKEHRVDFNILCCVSSESVKKPVEIYRFFREQGVEFIQFIPIVERLPDGASKELGLHLATPPRLREDPEEVPVTPWTVAPEGYGDFLIGVFEEWVRNDVGDVFVMNFEWALNSWMYGNSPACLFSGRCGRAVIIEHNGDIYSCDHYMYPGYRLGNILENDVLGMIDSEQQTAFGAQKELALPSACRECVYLFACRGECPKHRFMKTLSGEPGLNYLCKAYKKYFRHINKYMRAMLQLIENDLPVSYIMEAIDGPLVIRRSE